MKIVFAGTPDFSANILQSLILKNKYNINLVLSQPDRPKGRGKKLQPTPVKNIAEKYQINIAQPNKLRNNSEIINKIQNINPDLIIVVAYGMIIPQEILDIPKYGCINIHTSLLPKWRGAAPIQRAIEAGDNTTGVTIMQMDAGLDTGNILLTQSCDITAEDTALTLTDKLLEISKTLIIDAVDNIENLIKNSINQDSIKNIPVTYAEKITKQEAHINWKNQAKVISQKIRAFYPFPGAYCFLDDIRVKLIEVSVSKEQIETANDQVCPGTIVSINKNYILVKTLDDNIYLQISKLQLPGSKPLNINDILNSKHRDLFKINNIFT